MKKIISILLVCAMLLSLGITATATETDKTDDTDIEQIERIDMASLENGRDENNVYTGILYPNAGNSDYTGSLKIAHDGDYLYLVSWGTTHDDNRTRFETHIYIELGDTKYQIVTGPNYGQYKNSDANVNQYVGPGTTSRYDNGYEFYYRFGVFAKETGAYPTDSGVDAEDALKYGIFSGLNYPGKTGWNTLGGGHEIVIPMPESIRSKLGSGENVDVKIGFTYMHNAAISAKEEDGDHCKVIEWSTTGTAPTDTPSNWRAWANSGSTNALVDVTLEGTAQNDNAQVPYNTTSSTLVGVQTNLATDAEKGTTYSARFVAALNTSDLTNAKIYFRFVGKATVNEQCNTVFNSITADGNDVPAWYLGADYLYCLKVNDLKFGTEYEFKIGAYCEGQDAVTMYTVTVKADGTITAVASPLA